MSSITYLGYAKAGREFEVIEALAEKGIDAWCGRKLEFLRKGKQRRYERHESAYLPNYIFADLTPHQFLDAVSVKHLAATLTPLSERDRRALNVFRQMVEAEYENAQRIARNQDTICEYKRGQAIRAIDGPFRDTLLKFVNLVHRSHDPYAKIIAEADLFGRSTMVELDPISVRAEK